MIGSLKRIKDPETASYWSPQLVDAANMEVVNDHEVKVATPQATILPALAHITAAILPMKELREGSFDPASQMLGSTPTPCRTTCGRRRPTPCWTRRATLHPRWR